MLRLFVKLLRCLHNYRASVRNLQSLHSLYDTGEWEKCEMNAGQKPVTDSWLTYISNQIMYSSLTSLLPHFFSSKTLLRLSKHYPPGTKIYCRKCCYNLTTAVSSASGRCQCRCGWWHLLLLRKVPVVSPEEACRDCTGTLMVERSTWRRILSLMPAKLWTTWVLNWNAAYNCWVSWETSHSKTCNMLANLFW